MYSENQDQVTTQKQQKKKFLEFKKVTIIKKSYQQ
jgi:hypothetical protein